jgi:hypothetical protein
MTLATLLAAQPLVPGYPDIARGYLDLSKQAATALAATSWPEGSDGKPLSQSLNQTVERAVWNATRLT